jgi:hypothetical protein
MNSTPEKDLKRFLLREAYREQRKSGNASRDILKIKVEKVEKKVRPQAVKVQITEKRKNKTGFKGVSLELSTLRYRAQIMIKGKYLSLGHFYEAVDANAAYLRARGLYREFGVKAVDMILNNNGKNGQYA